MRTLPICKTFDCCVSSEEGEDSGEDAVEDTYIDELSNYNDDDSDSECDVEKRETAPFRMLSCAR